MIRISLVRSAPRYILPSALAALLLLIAPSARADVIVSEIHFNPDGNDITREFIEVKNGGDEAVSIAGWGFTQGITFTFPAGTTLEPGQILVLVANAASFSANYPGVPVFGQYGNDDGVIDDKGGLDNSDERVTLQDAATNEVFSFKYWDGNGAPAAGGDADDYERERWPSSADGDGYTLVSLDPNANPDPDDYRNWRPSINVHGSPGLNEPLPNPLEPIFVNEVRTRDGVLDNDAVELYNPGASDVNVGDWFLSDNLEGLSGNPPEDRRKKSPIPVGTIVPAGGYVVLENGVNGFSMSLSSKGERVFLYSANAAGVLTGWVHGTHTEASEDGKTFARFVGSDGRQLYIADDPTLGAANGELVPPRVVITEIMYTPALGADLEYIKIANISGSNALLYDTTLFAPEPNMRIGGFGITLPGVQPTLAPGEEAFVVASTEAAFRAAYDVDPAARVFADPTGGSLSGGGEQLELRLPVTIDGESYSDPGNAASGRLYAVLDEVHYNDDEPWPTEADGSGYSIVKADPAAPGYEVTSWARSAERGGSAYGGGVVYVNEILAHTDLPQTDVIELFNPGALPVDIGGWFLTDDPLVPNKYVIPASTTIPAGGLWAVNEDNDGNPGAAPSGYFGSAFQISSRGDSVYLFSASGAATTGFAHGGSFRATQNGVSLTRHVNSAGRETFPPQSGAPTVEINVTKAFPTGFPNNPPRVERAVISEIFYDPPAGHIEFVEVANISGATLPLYDTTPVGLGGNPNNNWALDGVTFTFPGAQPSLAPGERVVITPLGTDVAAFRTLYAIPAEVTIHGGATGFVGALNNAGEEVVLLRPDKPDIVAGQGIVVPMIQVDAINYDDLAPWPSGAGKSIERIDDSAFGDEPLNWQTTSAEFATPGSGPGVESGYGAWAATEFTPEELAGLGTGPGDDFNGDGTINLVAYGFGFSPKATITANDLPQPAIVTGGEGDVLGITFRQQIDAADLVYRVQRSDGLSSWTDIDNLQGAPTDNGDGTQTVTHGDLAPLADGAATFLRVLLELVAP